MEPKQALVHPSEAQLASFLDRALGSEALGALATHLDACPRCSARLEQIEPALSEYRQCLDAVQARIPRSPRRDTELWEGMQRLESARAPRRRLTWRLAWSSAMAAGLIVFAFLVLPDKSELRAETLLARVTVAAKQTTGNRRLLIRTRTASFVRSSERHPDSAEEQAVREHFAAAHYDWRDPLGPQAYSDWRHSLKHKTSKVFADGIETSTTEGSLVDASLTLNAQLVPVKGSFRFADQESIEITALSDASPEPAPAVPSVKAIASAPRPLAVERELEVRLAIDALQLGAGEPIEVVVDAEGGILVTTYHLTNEQQKDLQTRLEQIDGVTLRAAEGTEPAVSPPLADPSDRVLRASQDVSFEAHALAELDGRFDGVELSASSRRGLLALRKKHAEELNRDLAILQGELNVPSGASDPAGAQVAELAKRASTVDRLISEIYAGSATEPEQAEMKRQLQSEFARLTSLATTYLKSVQ